jgi:hypothetical protein
MLVVLSSGGVFIHEHQDGYLRLARLSKHDSPRLEPVLFVELVCFRQQVARAARPETFAEQRVREVPKEKATPCELELALLRAPLGK